MLIIHNCIKNMKAKAKKIIVREKQRGRKVEEKESKAKICNWLNISHFDLDLHFSETY